MLDPRAIDPSEDLVPRSTITDAEIDEVVDVMAALREWHAASERMSAASQRYMGLNSTDMRAIRYLMSAGNSGDLVTPGRLAEHLGISTAATTKMLDRLERGGHITRDPHPRDRRALSVRVTPETRAAARHSVGIIHARRFAVAAALTPRDRRVVRDFLRALAATEQAESTEDARSDAHDTGSTSADAQATASTGTDLTGTVSTGTDSPDPASAADPPGAAS